MKVFCFFSSEKKSFLEIEFHPQIGVLGGGGGRQGRKLPTLR